MSKREKDRIFSLKREIEKFPVMQTSDDIKSFKDLSKRDQMTITRLDEIFWEIIPLMASGILLQEVNPIGNKEKALAIREITERRKTNLENIMYVGDSVTDTSAFRLIKSQGGLTVSFNGNEYAIKEAEVAVISGNASITSILAYIFSKSKYDKENVLDMIHDWSYETLKKYCDDKILLDSFMKQHPSPEIEVITKDNIEIMIQKSTNFRKSVRGEAIGSLG
jgi:energy-converting hydrogenase A subunit R